MTFVGPPFNAGGGGWSGDPKPVFAAFSGEKFTKEMTCGAREAAGRSDPPFGEGEGGWSGGPLTPYSHFSSSHKPRSGLEKNLEGLQRATEGERRVTVGPEGCGSPPHRRRHSRLWAPQG